MPIEDLTANQETLAPETETPGPRRASPPSPVAALLAGSGNLMLIGMLLAGLVAVYVMSLRKSAPPEAEQQNATEFQVNTMLQNFQIMAARQATKSNSAASVLETFKSNVRQVQIPLSELKGNPFIFHLATKGGGQSSEPAATNGQEARATAEAMEAVRSLQLQTVMVGSQNTTAMISNNILAEGQKIRGWTVTKIRPQEVTLTWKDKTYVLKLKQ